MNNAIDINFMLRTEKLEKLNMQTNDIIKNIKCLCKKCQCGAPMRPAIAGLAVTLKNKPINIRDITKKSIKESIALYHFKNLLGKSPSI